MIQKLTRGGRWMLPVLIVLAAVATVALVAHPHEVVALASASFDHLHTSLAAQPQLGIRGIGFAMAIPGVTEYAESIRTPVRVPALLNGFAREFRGQQLVADEVAPVVTVDDELGKYQIFGKDNLYQVDNTYAHGAIPNAITSRESEDNFVTELRVIRHPLLDKDTDPNRPGGSTRARRVTGKVTLATQIAREARVAAAYTTAANHVAANVLTKAGGSEWDAVGIVNTIQPITDLESRIQKITDGASVPRSAIDIVMADAVMSKAIRYNTAIRDYYKYTQKGVTTPELLAEFLGVRRVLIGTGLFAGAGVENTGNDISTGIVTTNLWSDFVWLGVVDTTDMDMLTFGRQFAYKRETGGQDIQIRQYRMADEGQRGDWIEAAEQRDLKLTANFAGALIVNALS